MKDFVWDPSVYARFAGHRGRPFFDLVSAIQAENPRRVVDLGCGPGEMTLTLAERWPDAEIIGLDSSEHMIERAQATLREAKDAGRKVDNVSFASQDATTWMPETGTDVVVSNAMMQWIPNHRELMATWLEALEEGSWFGMQVPANHEAPSHSTISELITRPEYAEAGEGLYVKETADSPFEYSHTLIDASFRTNVWESTYYQLLSGEDPVYEWVSGAVMRPVLQGLESMDARDGTDKKTEFVAEYQARMKQDYPAFQTPEGTQATIFPMRRIFAVGYKTWDYFI